jgi:ArsR family transcriptional regulator
MIEMSELKRGISDSKERVEKLIYESELSKTCSNLEGWKNSIANIPAYKDADMISQFLKIISNPIRMKILLILLERDWACNCEFEYAFDIHQALISHHLKLLRDGNLITFSKSGSWKYYKIRDEIRPYLKQLREFLTNGIQYMQTD